MKHMSEWPNTWQVDEPDLPYGEGLLTEFKPFVTHLITVEQLSASSINDISGTYSCSAAS